MKREIIKFTLSLPDINAFCAFNLPLANSKKSESLTPIIASAFFGDGPTPTAPSPVLKSMYHDCFLPSAFVTSIWKDPFT